MTASTIPPASRHGSVLRLQPDRLAEYKAYHATVWPEVLAAISRAHLQNFSIYHKDGYLFSYYEYTGRDYAADMKLLAADPSTQRWWALMEPMQAPLPTRQAHEWWAGMEEVFHHD